jgi:hypothetical protein
MQQAARAHMLSDVRYDEDGSDSNHMHDLLFTACKLNVSCAERMCARNHEENHKNIVTHS